MKVRAHWKSINPFIPDIDQLGYTKQLTFRMILI